MRTPSNIQTNCYFRWVETSGDPMKFAVSRKWPECNTSTDNIFWNSQGPSSFIVQSCLSPISPSQTFSTERSSSTHIVGELNCWIFLLERLWRVSWGWSLRFGEETDVRSQYFSNSGKTCWLGVHDLWEPSSGFEIYCIKEGFTIISST